MLLKTNLKALKLPTTSAEHEKRAREAVSRDEAIAWGRSLCRLGHRVRFVTAASRVTAWEEAQRPHRRDRVWSALDRSDVLIVDELGYLSFSRSGAELLLRVFAEWYERRSRLVTSNRPLREWGTVFPGERMTAAVLDRLAHRCAIAETGGDSSRPRSRGRASRRGRAPRRKSRRSPPHQWTSFPTRNGTWISCY